MENNKSQNSGAVKLLNKAKSALSQKTPSLKTNLCIALFAILSGSGYSQGLQTSYFGHAGYTAKFDDNTTTKNSSAFNSGGLDILLASEISEKFTALGEIFTGYRGDGSNGVTLSVERLYFKYSANNFLNVKLGRLYTPLGFWQSRYSQAQFFQPTINAPYAVRTKADKGIMTTNSVGLQLDGENIGKLRFSYYLMLDNSVGAPSLNTDNTDFKAMTAKLKIEPVQDLEIYASGRQDKIVTGGLSIQGNKATEDINQTILNGGIVHIAQSKPLEFAFEYFHVTNLSAIAGQSENQFMYGYLGYKIKKITPYAQVDILRFSKSDNYFTPDDLDGLVIGARYSIAPQAVIKMEYKYRHTPAINHQDVWSLQVAARF